ncbi:hypothetical protein QEH56_05000 [Pelagicoccus enzymogenes]|uniref:hypothetical protein n=1 Tax=Pelagicoccus enzymogenes TaxID=2773457 RepID=UPI00280FC481|nr:hypothetical protein [Pelagicoccus enzymogenes]MDQ8197493.1 hypothetical protein [Pelagicoccus enzymogenes]
MITLFLSLLALPLSLSATPIHSLDGETSELVAHLQSPFTFVLTVHSQDDLPEAQRLLTYAVSKDYPSIVLIAIPSRKLEAIAIRRAAKSYFQSEFSRSLTYFIKAEDHPYPEFKTLLLNPTEPEPLYRFKDYTPSPIESLPQPMQ